MDLEQNGLQRVGIEQADIDAMRKDWLTDACIHELISRFGNFKNPRISIVDPSWLNEWIRLDGYSPPDTPIFFQPRNGAVGRPTGLVIPFNEGNKHWTVLYVDLEGCGGVYFTTMQDKIREANTRGYMLQFIMCLENTSRAVGLRGLSLRLMRNVRCWVMGGAVASIVLLLWLIC
jgi:hypothetical protein